MRYASLAVTLGAPNEEAVERVKRSLGFLRRKRRGRGERNEPASSARATAGLSVEVRRVASSCATAATRNPLSKKSLSPSPVAPSTRCSGATAPASPRSCAASSASRSRRRARCSLFGEDVWKHRARLMAKVGVVPEDPDAPPAMTARQLSAFCARLYPVVGRGVRRGAPRALRRPGRRRRSAASRRVRGRSSRSSLALASVARPPRPRRPDARPRRRRARARSSTSSSASWPTGGRPSSSRRTTSRASRRWPTASGS